MVYCSKCAINLLQQGFKVQEIQCHKKNIGVRSGENEEKGSSYYYNQTKYEVEDDEDE